MTLNGVIVLTLRNFTEFGSFQDGLRKNGCRYTDTFIGGNVGQRIKFLMTSFTAIFVGDHP